MCAYTLSTRSLLQTTLHLTTTGPSFTKKTFRLLALVGVKSLTLMPAIWLIQSAFRLVGWHFYPRDAMLARVIEITTCPSVCLSVRLSVTRRYCVKTKKASGLISSPSDSPKTLVFWRQISSPNSKGLPRTGASNMGRSEKFSDFLALSVYISKTVADTAKVTISH